MSEVTKQRVEKLLDDLKTLGCKMYQQQGTGKMVIIPPNAGYMSKKKLEKLIYRFFILGRMRKLHPQVNRHRSVTHYILDDDDDEMRRTMTILNNAD